MKSPLIPTATGVAIMATLGLSISALADTPENKIAPESEASIKQPTPIVQKISPGVYQIGKVTLDKNSREIKFPAYINISERGTLLEYVVVHLNGEKTHEALLITEADPLHINIAFKLLNYKESPELFRLEKPDGTPSDKFPVVAENIRIASRFTIHMEWKENKELKSAPVTHFLLHRITGKPMPDTPWVYNGSYIHKHKFKAKLTGSIFTICPNLGAIANYPGEDRDDDTLWSPASGTPKQGTPVTITLKPWKGKILIPKSKTPNPKH